MTRSHKPRVVLLQDGSWPDVPGVCCWRSAVEAAVTAAGATVETATVLTSPQVPARVPKRRAQAPASPGRLAWLPPAVRRPLAATYRRLRSTAPAPARPPAAPKPAAIPQLAGASLVVAESLTAATTAVAQGVPRHRVWALVLPPQWLAADDSAGQAAELIAAARQIGGFLTDSEPARESIERATSAVRPRVEVFPPLAVDRTCPRCADADLDLRNAGPPEVEQLRFWRSLLGEHAGPVPYSFAVARFRGPAPDWLPEPWVSWEGRSSARPRPLHPTEWTQAAQLRAARAVLDLVAPAASAASRPARSALVAGYDLKFAVELSEQLAARADLNVVVDDWPRLDRPTPQTPARLARAESIFAEWARPSAVWLSQRKRPGQFLAVRLHRFELDAPYPRDLVIDNVDAVVYIAPLFGRRIRDELGWPVEKLVYIPNYLDLGWLDRPKLPEARFGLGFVGIEWERKRFDLALDLLAALRREDRRYTLVVRSVMPWQNRYAWTRPQEQAYAGWCFTRIEQDPWLRDGVRFDPPGRDMARWYRQVGHVLSTSDEEGCHTAVAEGMAAGAVPVVRPWPGADEIYGKEWIHHSTEAAAAEILANADEARWSARAARAKAEINRSYDPAAVVEAWADLLHADLPAARGPFAEYAGSLA